MFTATCLYAGILMAVNGNVVSNQQPAARCQRVTPRDKDKTTYSPYILNGQPADIKNYPFKLSLHIFDSFECGASVISFKWSLTAGEKINYLVISNFCRFFYLHIILGHCLESQISAEFVSDNVLCCCSFHFVFVCR